MFLKIRQTYNQMNKNPHIYIYHLNLEYFQREKVVYNYYFNNDPERISESGMNNMIDQKTQEITT